MLASGFRIAKEGSVTNEEATDIGERHLSACRDNERKSIRHYNKPFTKMAKKKKYRIVENGEGNKKLLCKIAVNNDIVKRQ